MRLILMIVIGVAILVMLVVAVIMNRKRKFFPNYRAFFIVGITWLPLGVIMKNYVFSAVGACFLIAGLVNKKKWKEEIKWADLPPDIRRLKLFIVIFLAVLLLIGIAAYFLTRQGII